MSEAAGFIPEYNGNGHTIRAYDMGNLTGLNLIQFPDGSPLGIPVFPGMHLGMLIQNNTDKTQGYPFYIGKQNHDLNGGSDPRDPANNGFYLLHPGFRMIISHFFYRGLDGHERLPLIVSVDPKTREDKDYDPTANLIRIFRREASLNLAERIKLDLQGFFSLIRNDQTVITKPNYNQYNAEGQATLQPGTKQRTKEAQVNIELSPARQLMFFRLLPRDAYGNLLGFPASSLTRELGFFEKIRVEKGRTKTFV